MVNMNVRPRSTTIQRIRTLPGMRVLGRSPLMAAGVGLAASALGLVPAASASPDTPPGAPQVDFGPCQDDALVAADAQCGTVTVPLDHRRPDGATIDVAVSRLPARDPEGRRGVLLFNPGGPGAPGLAYPLQVRDALGEVADRYDLIGFDPRFAGLSSPITCGPTKFSDTFRSAGRDRTGFLESRELAADFARRCVDRHADVLPYAGTADVARDLDVIRSALGEDRIAYYGVSGGADLGAVYSELFPRRVDRMVLDSSPEGPWYQRVREQGRAADAAFDDWARWTAARHDEYRLGATAAAVRAEVERLVDRVARRPLSIDVAGEPHRVDDNVLPLLLQRWLNHEDDDASLADGVRDLADAAAGEPMTPSDELAERLAFFDAHDPALDNGLAVAWASLCDDGSWPRDPREYWRQIQRSRHAQLLFGPLANNVRPCAFWPAAASEPPVEIGNAVPILMVQAKGDSATPLAGARRLHERLVGSRLVTADVRAHGVYGRATEGRPPVPCVDRAVNAYLGHGMLPGHDVSCTGPTP